jgi:hypothetical protein
VLGAGEELGAADEAVGVNAAEDSIAEDAVGVTASVALSNVDSVCGAEVAMVTASETASNVDSICGVEETAGAGSAEKGVWVVVGAGSSGSTTCFSTVGVASITSTMLVVVSVVSETLDWTVVA